MVQGGQSQGWDQGSRESDSPLTSSGDGGGGGWQQNLGMQLPKLAMQLLQAAVGGPQQLLHMAQVTAVCGHTPQVLHALLELQLLLDGSTDHLFLILGGSLASPGLQRAELS